MKTQLNYILFCLSISIGVFACKAYKTLPVVSSQDTSFSQAPKLSLAQWTYHKQLFDGTMDNHDFIRKAAKFGFSGVEFVNRFFQDEVDNSMFLDSLKYTLDSAGLHPVMIMVDGEGNLGNANQEARDLAVAQHKKWLKATSYIGASLMRVNAHGEGTPEQMMEACTKSIIALSKYGEEVDVGIIIENHGSYSSDADWLLALYNSIDRPNVHLLVDFDNWCMERENGKLWGAPCIKEYDRYEGVAKLIPYARGVSLKSFDFDENGDEVKTDFARMFKFIDEAEYNGYLGVEYEGTVLLPDDGVKKTIALAYRYMK